MSIGDPQDLAGKMRAMRDVLERALQNEPTERLAMTGHPELDGLAGQVNALLDRLDSPRPDRKQEAFFKRVFDVLPAEVVIFDSDFRYLYINPIAVKDPEIRNWMIGRNDIEYCEMRGMDTRIGVERQQLYKDTIKSGASTAIIQEMVDREGKVRNHLRCLSPVFDVNGDVEMLIGYSIEVTAMRKNERELREKHKALEKTSRELDQFVYRASHDLRSPLVSIMGLVNLIEMESPPPGFQSYLKMIKGRVAKLDLVIREIVNFSKNSNQEVEIHRIDPHHQIREVLEDLSQVSNFNKVEIVQDISAPYEWFSDSFRVGLLLTNLISNALKFQKPGIAKPFVRIGVKVLPEEVCLEVEDNGVGIPKKAQDQVFEMFFRGTHNGSGSGIGLYIVREILDKMNGEIDFESKEGAGTRFSVRLPNFPSPILQD